MNFPGVDADALPFLSRKIVEHMGKKYTAKVRKQFRNYGYGDAGASKTRRAFKKYHAVSGSPKQDIDRHNSVLRSRARSLYMSAPLATSAIKTLRTAIVGPGLYLHAQVDGKMLGISEDESKKLNKLLEMEFELWAADRRSASVSGLSDFYEQQQIALMAWKTSGDTFALFDVGETDILHPYSLRLRLIEADRICTPSTTNVSPLSTYGKNTDTGNNIYDGVEVNEKGRVVAYHIRNTFPGELSTETVKWARVEAIGKRTGMPNILHIMDAERPEQYRGVTSLAPCIENIMQLGRYLNSEEAAALLQTCFTIYVTTETDGDGPALKPQGLSSDADEEVGDEDDRNPEDYEMSPGGVAFLRPGEDIKSVDPKHPTNSFDGFVRAVATQIGAAMEVPVDVLLKSYNTSYSAARAALQDFWKKVVIDRIEFASTFCKPVYEAWFCEAVARGRISAPGFFTDPLKRAAYLAHEWNGPSMPHLDPVKEATAMEIMVRNGWKTNTQATTELNGGDFNKNVEQLLQEMDQFAPLLVMISEAVSIRKSLSSDSSKKDTEQKQENEYTT